MEKPKYSPETLSWARENLENLGFEQTLTLLRNADYTKIDAILILQKLSGDDFYITKCRVHWSKTWEDVRERDAQFENLFFDVIEGPYDSQDD